MRQDAVGERHEPDRDVRKRRTDGRRRLLRTVDAHGRLGIALREHRARHVEHHECLGVGAKPLIPRPLDDGLGSREAEKRCAGAERGEGDGERPSPGCGHTERLAHVPGLSPRAKHRDERETDAEREQRSERREDREGHA